jgi:hypothetical protein
MEPALAGRVLIATAKAARVTRAKDRKNLFMSQSAFLEVGSNPN